jgi:DMSO/TMAO reductase YedYZ molybdopterin-dependent catalytic subunit
MLSLENVCEDDMQSVSGSLGWDQLQPWLAVGASMPSGTLTEMASDERHESLPPGQRARPDFPRFGLPAFASRWPRVPTAPKLSVGGEVTESLTVDLCELATLPRRTQRSDLHCVTTWSALGMRWGGVRFRDFYEQIIVPRAEPAAGCAYVVFRGLDGFRTSLPLEDALAPDVLIADELDGAALPLEHGAPRRLVAPAHYAYKSVKHLSAIEMRRAGVRSLAGPGEHPRGRVDLEERGTTLPGWACRRIWRAGLPAYLRWFQWQSRRTRG